MNYNKISFIFCVSDKLLYKKSLDYVKSLKVPNGYTIEIIPIQHAVSITSGYNQGMQRSDAKYKVYIHQDVYILNQNFLFDVITLFEIYPNLGMFGVIGAITLPESGIWWEGKAFYGKLKANTGDDILTFSFGGSNDNDYEKVEVIDGLIMITQYDLQWREDLFKGWHFYDASQSLEFAKAGYVVGVAKQETPWCFHDHGPINMNGYEENRKTFVQNYKSMILKNDIGGN